MKLSDEIQEVTTKDQSIPLYSSSKPYTTSSDHYSRSMSSSTSKYTTYWYRWMILFLYSFCNLCSGFIMVSFSACAPAIAVIYDTSEFVVGLSTQVFIFLFVPINFPSVWIIDNWGLRVSIVSGIILTAAGMWIRLVVIIQPHFYWVLIGQVLGGIGSPLLLNSAAKLGTTWFSVNERPLATSIGAVFLQVGNAIAFKLPTWYFKPKEYYDDHQDEGRKSMSRYLWMYAIVGSVCCLLTVVLMRAKPKTPPSKSATIQKASLCKDVRTLFKNCNFIVMLVGYSLVYGVYTIFGACVSFFTDHYGIDISSTGNLALTFILVGLAGSIFFSALVMKTGLYKCTYIVFAHFTLGFAASVVTIQKGTQQLSWAYFCIAFAGFNLIPIIPLSYDFGSEIAYPVSEAVVCGSLLIVAQLWGTLFYFVVNAIIAASVGLAMWSLVISTAVGLVFMFFIKQDLRRKRADELDAMIVSEDNPGSEREESFYSSHGPRVT